MILKGWGPPVASNPSRSWTRRLREAVLHDHVEVWGLCTPNFYVIMESPGPRTSSADTTGCSSTTLISGPATSARRLPLAAAGRCQAVPAGDIVIPRRYRGRL